MLRSVLFTLLLGLFVNSAAQAQHWAEKMFETRSHDFGTIARGAKAEYKFILSNIYLEDVHILSARPSCGCTSVKIEKPLLKTYEKGAVVASINSRTFLGRQGATITVTFDKPFYARVRLPVKVYVQSEVVVEPGVVDLGNVEQGVLAEKAVSVTCTRRSDWEILDVKSGSPHLSAKVVETKRQGSRVSYELRVSLGEKAPPGYLNEHLILVTNDSRSSQIPVMVQGQVLSAITVNPSTLFLGVVPSGQRLTKNLVVRGKEPFRIVSLTADCECLQFGAAADGKAKPLHLVSVTFTAGEKQGKIAKNIRIETDLDGAIAEVTAYAVVVGQ